jgi:hypothetical protein
MSTHTADNPAYMMVDAYVKADTRVRRGLERHQQNEQPCVWIRVGRFPACVGIYFATLADIDRFAQTLADARQDLAEAQGYLPNGEPCEYADLFGCPLWDEHDHDQCITNPPTNSHASTAAQLPLHHDTKPNNRTDRTDRTDRGSESKVIGAPTDESLCICGHSHRSHDDHTGACYVHPTYLGETEWRCGCVGYTAGTDGSRGEPR